MPAQGGGLPTLKLWTHAWLLPRLRSLFQVKSHFICPEPVERPLRPATVILRDRRAQSANTLSPAVRPPCPPRITSAFPSRCFASALHIAASLRKTSRAQAAAPFVRYFNELDLSPLLHTHSPSPTSTSQASSTSPTLFIPHSPFPNKYITPIIMHASLAATACALMLG